MCAFKFLLARLFKSHVNITVQVYKRQIKYFTAFAASRLNCNQQNSILFWLVSRKVSTKGTQTQHPPVSQIPFVTDVKKNGNLEFWP